MGLPELRQGARKQPQSPRGCPVRLPVLPLLRLLLPDRGRRQCAQSMGHQEHVRSTTRLPQQVGAGDQPGGVEQGGPGHGLVGQRGQVYPVGPDYPAAKVCPRLQVLLGPVAPHPHIRDVGEHQPAGHGGRGGLEQLDPGVPAQREQQTVSLHPIYCYFHR